MQIIPFEKHLAAAAQAMGREVFKSELSDPQALVAEFLERAASAHLKNAFRENSITENRGRYSKHAVVNRAVAGLSWEKGWEKKFKAATLDPEMPEFEGVAGGFYARQREVEGVPEAAALAQS